MRILEKQDHPKNSFITFVYFYNFQQCDKWPTTKTNSSQTASHNKSIRRNRRDLCAHGGGKQKQNMLLRWLMHSPPRRHRSASANVVLDLRLIESYTPPHRGVGVIAFFSVLHRAKRYLRRYIGGRGWQRVHSFGIDG